MLTTDELILIAWYRLLDSLEQLAIRCSVVTGDTRLITLIWGGIIDHDTQNMLNIALSQSA